MNSALARIDRDLGGPPLKAKNAAAFEHAWAEFNERFDPAAGNGAARIQEIAQLLEVTADNLEEVKNQKWFQRAWGTVSGKNRRLARTNEQNLLQVQKGAFFFLEGLAAQNQIMMQAVYFALQRVEDNQIQNERLKGHLLQVVRKYNDRIRGIEARQDELERRLDEQLDARGRASLLVPVLAFLLGVTLVAVGGFVLMAEGLTASGMLPEGLAAVVEPAWALPVGVVTGGIGFATASVGLVSGLMRRRASSSTALVPAAPPEDPRIAIRADNARRRPKLRAELADALKERYANFIASQLAEPLFEVVEELDGAFDFDDDDPSSDEFAAAMGAFLAISGDLADRLRSAAREAAGDVRDDFNGLVTAVVEIDLDNDLGAKLAGEVERSKQSALAHDLVQSLEVYEPTMDVIEAERASLLSRFERWKGVATEGLAYGVGKAFLKGLFVVPALLDDEQEFMSTFQADAEKLETRWNSFRETLGASLDSRVAAAVGPFVADAMEHADALFDACDEAGVPLADVETTMVAYLTPDDEEPHQGSARSAAPGANDCPSCGRRYTASDTWCPDCEVAL